jgi:WD40 repeat protein
LAAASFSRIFLWDLGQNVLLKELVGHKGLIYSIKFSKDNSVLATASQDKSVKLWDVETGKLLNSLEHRKEVRDVAFSPDQTTLATVSFFEDFIRIWRSWKVD